MENFIKYIWSKLNIHKPPVDLWNKIERELDVKAVSNNIEKPLSNYTKPIQNKYLKYFYLSGITLTILALFYFIYHKNYKDTSNDLKQKKISVIANNNIGITKNENKAEALANKSGIDNIDLMKGLIAWYPFNGNANDMSGNKNNGIIHDAILTADRFGNPNSAYYFDGYDSYIEVANSPSLNPTKAISLCVWYKPDDFCGDENTGIIEKDFTSYVAPYYQYKLSAVGTGAYLFGFWTSILGKQKAGHSNSNTWTVGNWYFLVVTYDDTEVKFYLNNVLIQTMPATGAISSYNTPLYIGRTGFTTNNNFIKGAIDDIRMFNRALTVREINKLFHDRPLKGKKEKITTAPINISVKQNFIKNELTIVSNSDIKQNIEIINLKGEIIYQATMNKKTILDISGFVKGVYKLKLTTDKETHVEIFIKQ